MQYCAMGDHTLVWRAALRSSPIPAKLVPSFRATLPAETDGIRAPGWILIPVGTSPASGRQ